MSIKLYAFLEEDLHLDENLSYLLFTIIVLVEIYIVESVLFQSLHWLSHYTLLLSTAKNQ